MKLNSEFEQLYQSTRQRFYDLSDIYSASWLNERISSWLKMQISCCSDSSYSAIFSDHIDLPGIKSEDYLQRIIPVGDGLLLGGIRFYNRNLERPFVDLMAWSGMPDWDLWMAVIRREWAIFKPLHVRLLRGDPHDGMMLPEGCVDQSIHSGQINTLAQFPSLPSLQLIDCENFQEAADYVAECHQAFASLNPSLALEVRPADAEDLAECLETGTLHFVILNNERIGLFATAWRAIEFIQGYVVVEEIIHPAFQGRGLAKYVQREAAALLNKAGEGEKTMIGTIHAHNIASRKTAIGAGRPEILQYEFISL